MLAIRSGQMAWTTAHVRAVVKTPYIQPSSPLERILYNHCIYIASLYSPLQGVLTMAHVSNFGRGLKPGQGVRRSRPTIRGPNTDKESSRALLIRTLPKNGALILGNLLIKPSYTSAAVATMLCDVGPTTSGLCHQCQFANSGLSYCVTILI